MKFLLQVRFNGAGTVIGELPAREQQKVTAEFEAIRRSPGVLDGNQLEPVPTAKTVRVSDGQTLVTDGPDVSHGPAMDGYYIFDGRHRVSVARAMRHRDIDAWVTGPRSGLA